MEKTPKDNAADDGDHHFHYINDEMNQSHYLKLDKKNGFLASANNIISYLSILDLILYNFLYFYHYKSTTETKAVDLPINDKTLFSLWISQLRYTICLTHISKITIHLMINSTPHYSKKYMEKGRFDEFGIDILISRLNSNVETKTIDDLVHRLDLLYFDDAEKALLYIDLLFEAVKELDSEVKELLFYEIKLLLEQEMAKRLNHKDFEHRRFELRVCPDRIVLVARCKNCNLYFVADSEILYYLRKSNLAPYTPVPKSECPECHKRSLILPRL